jgi:hypothetical protein
MPDGWRRLDSEELKGPSGKPYVSLPNRLENNGNPILNKEGKETYAPWLESD